MELIGRSGGCAFAERLNLQIFSPICREKWSLCWRGFVVHLMESRRPWWNKEQLTLLVHEFSKQWCFNYFSAVCHSYCAWSLLVQLSKCCCSRNLGRRARPRLFSPKWPIANFRADKHSLQTAFAKTVLNRKVMPCGKQTNNWWKSGQLRLFCCCHDLTKQNLRV